MRVIIAGNLKSLTYDDLSRIIGDSGFDISGVLVGGTNNTSLLGLDWAYEHDIPWYYFELEAKKYRRHAHMVMDRSMVSDADGLILVWDGLDGKSRGLRFLAKQRGLEIFDQVIQNP